MESIVGDRGQVTIPQALRRRLGIRPRTVLRFHEEHGRLVAEKAADTDPVASVRGCLKLDRPVDRVIEAMRGPA